MKTTVKLVGQAIRNAAVYLPIRNHAAAVATTAPPKNYAGQLNAVYNDFIHRWRYVRDPAHKELVTSSPEALWRYVLAGDGVGVGYGRGAGDCDCASSAIGAELLSIGFPVRLATTAPAGSVSGPLFGHIFVQAEIPKSGWVTVDPVLHPHQPFGATARHSRIAYWDLFGNLLGFSGNVKGLGNDTEGGDNMMLGYSNEEIQDYTGLVGFGGVDQWGEPDDWESVGLDNWGHLSPILGIINGDDLPLPVEVVTDSQGLARTPMIELSPSDYNYVQVYKRPYMGMLGLGDDGTVYKWEDNSGMLGGWFKRLFKKVKKGIKKIGRKIKKGIKKVVRMLPGGKLLLKIAKKIHKVAMKIVKPLIKFVGKYASKLAPIAALIPGYGPAIAAGLHAAGKVAKLMTKYGVGFKGKKGKVRSLTAKDPKNITDMQKELGVLAKQQKAMQERKKAAGMTDNQVIARAKRAARSSRGRGQPMYTGTPYTFSLYR